MMGFEVVSSNQTSLSTGLKFAYDAISERMYWKIGLISCGDFIWQKLSSRICSLDCFIIDFRDHHYIFN